MAGKLHFSLVSPERELFSGEVDQVDAPGTEGDFGVLAGHAPVMAVIRPGDLLVYPAAGASPERIRIESGFAEVNAAGLTVLAEQTDAAAAETD